MHDLVIVGGGPSALRALADVDIALSDVAAGVRPIIAVIEPALPGAGSVWDPAQPHHLILNADSAIVDMRCPSVPHSYRQWADSDDPFPARGHVGAYLAWAFERLRRSGPWTLTHHAARATAIAPLPHGQGYAVQVTGSTAVQGREVLLTTGHTLAGVPDHRSLSERPEAREETVLVRGAALTAFDVVADLTIGRGGSFERGPDRRLLYRPGGGEPRSVALVSRTGETMLPKPVTPSGDEAAAVRSHTRVLRGRPEPSDGWWRVIADAAVAAAATHGVILNADDLENAWSLPPSGATDVSEQAAARWHSDLMRAFGHVDADARWWWGRAWAAGYDDIIAGIDRAPRTEAGWTQFRRRAARMERWAFGPPTITIERLLCLQESGLLRIHRGRVPRRSSGAVTVVDAVTPGPGVLRAPRPWTAGGHAPPSAAHDVLWQRLLDDRTVFVRPGERGILTTPDAQCVRADGDLAPGMYALGRPTEGPTIGHDSLRRRVRPEFRAWAAGFARRTVDMAVAHDRMMSSPDRGAPV